ncbi:MAG: potassium transporter [Bacteroidales bacterium]|nr:potassium transporter [Bacteroidales bacterium]
MYRHYFIRLRSAFLLFCRRSAFPITVVGRIIDVMAFVAAIICGLGFIIYVGYDHTPQELRHLGRTLRTVQIVFTLQVVYNLLFHSLVSPGRRSLIRWIVDIAMLLSLFGWIWPVAGRMHWSIAYIVRSRVFLNIVLCAYAIVTFCYGVMHVVGKRTNPSLLLATSFLAFIGIGSLALMLPRCTYFPLSYVDALFVSTSAVCITGLCPVDVSVQFTPLGILVLTLLIQIGSLGVMTFTCFFALFFSGHQSIYSQLMLRDIIYSKSMSALVPTLLYILGFTLVVEAIGGAMVWLSIHGTLGMTLEEELIASAFHSISAFCNAGFSTIPSGLANPYLLAHNQSIYWITTLLVVAGSIGFPILVNFKDALKSHLLRLWRRLRRLPLGPRTVYLYNMNTRIVLVTYFVLVVATAILFFLWESGNTMRGMTLAEKVTQSVFNSASLRSAGFTSVNPALFLNTTLIVVMFSMWIGGASQSTAGGIKVNTFAAIMLNLVAIIRGRERINAFKRTIAIASLRRANCVVALSILSYVFYAVGLLWLEPHMGAKAVLFEALSALFTVGSSLGITASLSAASKVLLCTAMFLGRVGIISLLSGIAGHPHKPQPQFPSDNIIIN